MNYPHVCTKGRILNDTSYPNIGLPQFEFWYLFHRSSDGPVSIFCFQNKEILIKTQLFLNRGWVSKFGTGLKNIFFLFFPISHEPCKLQSRTIRQNMRLNLINFICFMIHVEKMTKNRLNRAIYESQIFKPSAIFADSPSSFELSK